MTPWWNAQDGNFYGALAGTAIGLAGGALGILVGLLAPRGKAKRLVFGALALLIAVGGFALLAGLAALINGQPRHVWYPLVLVGGIVTFVLPIQVPMIRARYRAAEMRKLEAEALRRE